MLGPGAFLYSLKIGSTVVPFLTKATGMTGEALAVQEQFRTADPLSQDVLKSRRRWDGMSCRDVGLRVQDVIASYTSLHLIIPP